MREAEPEPPEHRIAARAVDGNGEFYDVTTGARYVPRGMNYNRWITPSGGGVYDDVLTVEHYDPATVTADLVEMRALGFNTLRVLIDTCHPNSGCTGTGPGSPHVNEAYLDNLAHFLALAADHDMVVLVGSNTLPDDSWWLNETARVATPDFSGAANEFLNPAAVPVYADYWRQLVQGLVDRGATANVLGYELRQEHHFWSTDAPLALDEGLVTTANGATYDMSDQADKDQMIDEGLVYWADTLRTEIRSIDPTALVTVGFFTPNYPHQVQGPDEPRVVRTHHFLRESSMDFMDLHHYPGNGVNDSDIWENFGIEGAEHMPIILGEYGAIRHWYPDEATGSAAVMAVEVNACRAGFDGYIFWAWRGDLNTGEYYATDGEHELAEVVAPVNRPDPCEFGEFAFIEFNAATTATATASSAVDGFGPERVRDSGPQHWNAAGRAPQWVNLALAAPTTVLRVELVVAQDPPGPSVHELWVQSAGGDFERVAVFDGTTADNDVLVFTPDAPMTAVEAVRVVTTSLPGLDPAWREIYVYSTEPPA